MATLTVLKFAAVDGAEKGLKLVEDLQKQALITLHDAAVVSWPVGARKPKTKQMANLAGAGALDGAFWGMLFGLIFFVPFFGMAIGALLGALSGHFADYGIDERFVKDVRAKVTEGTSALFLLTSDAVADRVIEAAKVLPKFEIIATNLPKDQEDKLRAAFGA
jgi:uncharacterized membrane protein